MSNVSIDQQFVEYVIKSIVGNPDAVSVARSVDEKGVLLELTVDPEDLGRVIGKRGATAQSVRTLLRALGTKNEARYNLKIIDNGEPRPEREPREERAPRDDMATAVSTDDASDDNSATATTVVVDEEAADTSTAPMPETETMDEPEEEKKESSSASKTRQELDDLDDLDI